jgi:4'-phosphopantetheinyl transferase
VAEINIDFSLSHTPASFLIGITPDGAIGVDMELLNGSEDLPSIVAWAFTEKESIYCDSGKDKKKFLEIWTSKEALLKLTGRGISTDLKQLCTLNHIVPDYSPQMVQRKHFTAPGGETCCVLLQNSNSCG